jgi:hypothetical protein
MPSSSRVSQVFGAIYATRWGVAPEELVYYSNIIPKFISADNTTFWMTFSGFATPVNWDSYNLIQGTFTLP